MITLTCSSSFLAMKLSGLTVFVASFASRACSTGPYAGVFLREGAIQRVEGRNERQASIGSEGSSRGKF